MRKGMMVKTIIYLVFFIILVLSFVLLISDTIGLRFITDSTCKWSVQMAAAGLPMNLRCQTNYLEIKEKELDNDVRLNKKIADEMMNCFSAFGSGKYESVVRTSTLSWIMNPRNSIRIKLEDSSGCFICSYVYVEDKNKDILIENLYEYLFTNFPKGSDKTYSEMLYERPNVLDYAKTSDYTNKVFSSNDLFIVYSEDRKENKNAVILVDQNTIRSSGICGAQLKTA